jgi:penicillin G amidase
MYFILMIKSILLTIIKPIVMFLFIGSKILWWVYKTKVEGVVELANAPGIATITREEGTEIAHIQGDSIDSAFFAQGYAHAQTRLW